MKKLFKGIVVTGLAVGIMATGVTGLSSMPVEASSQTATMETQINKLIEEKKSLIEKKRVSRNGAEQRQLGIRIGEIEREIAGLRKGQGSSNTGNNSEISKETQEKINKLIEEKKQVIEKKRISRDGQEQKQLGIRIGEIEREIAALRKGQGSSNTGNNSQIDKDVQEKINKLIAEKKQVIEKKRVSRDSQEQKQLGIRIGEIEREITALRKGQNSGNNGNDNKPQWVKDKIAYYKGLGRNYKGQADVNKSDVMFNKEKNNVTAYKFNDNNYFKLRDLAKLSKGTNSRFNVVWSEEKQAIMIKDNTDYKPVGGELENIKSGKKDVIENLSKIYYNGELVELESYTIDGNNYFKLRDLGDLLEFNVDWDEDTNRVIIDM